MYKLLFLNEKKVEDVKWFSHLDQIYKLDFSKILKWQIFHNGELIDSSSNGTAYLKERVKEASDG